MTKEGKFRWESRWMRSRAWALGLAVLLSGCFEEQKTAVSYTAYNHTDRWIIDIIVNGEGGILAASPRGGGGEMCCVVIPNKWRSGLNVTIKWRGGGEYKRDVQGNVFQINGVPEVIEDPWIEKTVEIPQYGEELGRFNIHFFPKDKIQVFVNNYGPGHPKYPIPDPDRPQSTPGKAAP